MVLSSKITALLTDWVKGTHPNNVNVLAKFERPCGLFQFFRVKHYLENILGCRVKWGTEKAKRAYVQSPVLQEALRCF
jgi:hypothetical protein